MIRQCFGLFLVVGTVLLAQKPSFEVASVKLNTSGRDGGTLGPRGDMFFATNVPLKSLLVYAFAPPNGLLLRHQIIGAPNWADTDRYDIQAKPEGNTRVIPGEPTKLMVQALLEDRFQLKAHRETRDMPVYHLVLNKRGPKLSADQTPPDPRQGFITFSSSADPAVPLPRGAIRMITESSGTTLLANAIHVSKLVSVLQGQADRMIFDKTGFTALFDVHLEFQSAATAQAAEPTPSLFTAIQELGFRLEPAKGPLEVVVIDSVEKPSQN
jgi:uncharacterized protein (TIGR03435 family)